MFLHALLRLLLALFRKLTQNCHRLNVADYSKKMWALMLVAIRRLFRHCPASGHEAGPLPIYKSFAASASPSVHAIDTSREDEMTSSASAPITSGKIELPHAHAEDHSRLEEGQQNRQEQTSQVYSHAPDEEHPQSTHVTPGQQLPPTPPKLLNPIFPWNLKLSRPRCKKSLSDLLSSHLPTGKNSGSKLG